MAVIYGLTNIVNGNAYVGSTAASLAKRFREHRCLLNNGKHTSKLLQSDWDKHKAQAFEMRVLEDMGPNVSFDARKKAEQRWIDAFKERDQLYNSYDVAFSMPMSTTKLGIEASRHVVGNRWSSDANAKRSAAQIGIPKNHGAKISATKRAKRAALLCR